MLSLTDVSVDYIKALALENTKVFGVTSLIGNLGTYFLEKRHC